LEMRATQRRVVSKMMMPNFTFWSPVKIRGGAWENAELEDRVYPIPPHLWYAFDRRPLHGVEV